MTTNAQFWGSITVEHKNAFTIMRLFISGLSYSVTFCLLFNINQVSAQIEIDNTLPTASRITKNGINLKIDGGTLRGNNLFHSFKKFDIPTRGEAFFNNINSVENIFTRVTGGSISNIDGIIKANGSANFFLMNPSGIIFGDNAKLDIGGSFIATTANSIKFTSGEFSAINPQAPPLLKVNLPVGLQFGQNSQKIAVNRNGSSATANIINSPIQRVNPQTQLEVKTGKTLALIAGDIDINGGIIESQGGNIELASVGSGTVKINRSQLNNQWNFDYQNIPDFKDINLQQTFINTSGGINLQARNITLNNGSQILNQNYGFQSAVDININASESVQLTGISPDKIVNTSLISEAFATGNGGNIAINTKRLELQNGAIIETRTYGAGKGGNIDVNSDLSLQINGVSQFNPGYVSGINTATVSFQKSGDIKISTDNLSIEDGANLTTSTLGTGDGGDINVNAANIKLTGFNTIANQPSLLSASTLNAGNAGNLIVNTSKLEISGGANINTSTLASGDAGNIVINAGDSVKITDSIEQFGFAIDSNINSSGTVLPEQVRLFLNLFSLPSGKAGDVTINTPKLNINNGGEVSVTNGGTGDAGSLYINTDSLKLNQQGVIAAETANGMGGDISLNTKNLQLRNHSSITATARGDGNGGNIKINTDTLVALENSDITANAQNSFGGRITINAQGVFGTQEREEVTPQSDITATSQLGASFTGTVELNTPGVDPSKGVNQLPANIIDPTNQIASGCGVKTGNSFVVTGRGGIPQNPSDRVNRNITWSDIRDLSLHRQQSININTARTTVLSQQKRIIEATGFITNVRGEVELVARIPENYQNWQQIPDCGEV